MKGNEEEGLEENERKWRGRITWKWKERKRKQEKKMKGKEEEWGEENERIGRRRGEVWEIGLEEKINICGWTSMC